MSLVVNNNVMANNVARNLNLHYGQLNTSTERLSSGLRINSAADDAAGLAIRELQRADITTLLQGARNSNDAISLIQTADSALQTIDDQLIRMKELAEQAATGTYDSTQRLMIESEYQQLASEITRIANATDFNGIKLLDGSLSGEYDGSELQSVGELKVHFGTANDSAEDFYKINIGDTRAASLGLGNEVVTLSEMETNPTNAGYEELRDRSAEKIYESTYEERYTTHYEDIFAKLVSTADPNLPPIPMENAAAQAAEQAALLAEREASADAEMAKATFDTIFDYTYMNLYISDARTTAFHATATPTVTQAANHEAATQDALKGAAEQMQSLTHKIAENGNLSGLDAMLPLPAITIGAVTIQGVSSFPVKNASTANAYIEQVAAEGYEAVYQRIYYGDPLANHGAEAVTGMYEFAIADAKAALGLTASESLTEEQVVAIQDMVHSIAHEKALEYAESMRVGLEKSYTDAFMDLDPASGAPLLSGNGYGELYDDYVTNGHFPPDIAQIMAETHAATQSTNPPARYSGWGTLDYEVGRGYFGIDPVTGLVDNPSNASLFISTTMDIPDSGNPPKQVTALANSRISITGDPIVARTTGRDIFEAMEVQMLSYIGDAALRGLNGSAEGLIETAVYFAEAFDGYSPAGSTISTQEAAGEALVAINEAIISKDKIRAHLGAMQNRLEETINNLNIQAENLQASESRISDVDVATEMTAFVRNQILTQSAVAMLSQANSLPQMAQQVIAG